MFLFDGYYNLCDYAIRIFKQVYIFLKNNSYVYHISLSRLFILKLIQYEKVSFFRNGNVRPFCNF